MISWKLKVVLVLRKVAWADPSVITITTHESAHATLHSTRTTLIQLTNSCTVRCGPKMKYLYAGGNFHLTDHMKLQVQYCNILRKNIDLQRFCANCVNKSFFWFQTRRNLCAMTLDSIFIKKKKKEAPAIKEFFLRNKLFITSPECFYIPIFFSNLNYNFSNLWDMRNTQGQGKKTTLLSKIVPTCHCSNKLF